jgi:hypothetical protein
MSKIGTINLDLQELVDEMGIENSVGNLTTDEREAVKANLRETIRTNSCETDCPHVQMLGLL